MNLGLDKVSGIVKGGSGMLGGLSRMGDVALPLLGYLALGFLVLLAFGFLYLMHVCRRPLQPLPWAEDEDLVIMGQRGSGKSCLAMRIAIEDPDSVIIVRKDKDGKPMVDAARLNALLAKRGDKVKHVRTFDKPGNLLGMHCGLRWDDEAQKDWRARGYKDSDPRAEQAVYEQRKDDGRVVYTIQNLRTFDLIPASFCTIVRLRPMTRHPFIGWPFMRPDCVRPPMTCRHVPDEYHDEPHRMRSGKGDQETLFERFLGFGSVIEWDIIDPELVIKGRTIGSSADPEVDPSVIASGRCFYSQEIAECYDSGALVGHDLVPMVKRERKEKTKKTPGVGVSAEPTTPPPGPSLPL